jgi:catechol 2,3-dioxygenase-like lactoylglutathione lyase family enzyme
MHQSIATIALVVADYDEAIAFYRDAIGFSLVEDTALGPDKRWVVMTPAGSSGARLLLAKADGPEQQAVVGRQAGGRVMLFLETDNFARDHKRMTANGVTFLEEPRQETYGLVAVFADLYGNKWDLIEPRR